MPAKPIIEPIDRSNSPPIISSAAPTAMMPRNAATVAQLTMPSALNMPESPAASPNNDEHQHRARDRAELRPRQEAAQRADVAHALVGRRRRRGPDDGRRNVGTGQGGLRSRVSDIGPAYFSTLAMLSLVTKPGPDEMWRGP